MQARNGHDVADAGDSKRGRCLIIQIVAVAQQKSLGKGCGIRREDGVDPCQQPISPQSRIIDRRHILAVFYFHLTAGIRQQKHALAAVVGRLFAASLRRKAEEKRTGKPVTRPELLLTIQIHQRLIGLTIYVRHHADSGAVVRLIAVIRYFKRRFDSSSVQLSGGVQVCLVVLVKP